MRLAFSLIVSVLVLFCSIGSGSDFPVLQRDVVRIIIADFEGPDISPTTPADWFYETFGSIVEEYDFVEISRLDRPLSSTARSEDAIDVLLANDATLIIWADYEVSGGVVTLSPDHEMPIPDTGESYLEVGSSSVMRGSGISWVHVEPVSLFGVEEHTLAAPMDTPVQDWVPMCRAYLGASFVVTGRYADGLEVLEEVVASPETGTDQPLTCALSYFYLGITYHQLGNHSAAEAAYNRFLEIDPDNYSGLVNRGNLYYEVGDSDRAIADLSRAIELRPESPDPYYTRGTFYCQMGEQELGILDLDKVIEINPLDVDAISNRGFAYFELGMLEEAVADMNRAIEIDPDDPTSYSNLAFVSMALEEYEEAIDWFDMAEARSDQPEAILYHRGCCYCYLVDFERAIEDFSRAIDLYPVYPSARKDRGRAYLELEEYDAALADFDSLIDEFPNWTEIYYWRGCVLAQTGDTEDARSDLNYVLDSAADFGLRADAWSILESLPE